MDMIDGIIVGAAAAAIGSIVAYKFINMQPQGGGQPAQPAQPVSTNFGYQRDKPLYVVNPIAPADAAPLSQPTPITEAAYNQYPTGFEHAFGPAVNQPNEEAVLPQ